MPANIELQQQMVAQRGRGVVECQPNHGSR